MMTHTHYKESQITSVQESLLADRGLAQVVQSSKVARVSEHSSMQTDRSCIPCVKRRRMSKLHWTDLQSSVGWSSSSLSGCEGLAGGDQGGGHVSQLLLCACLGPVALLLLLLHEGGGLLVLLLGFSQLTLKQPCKLHNAR